MAASVDRRVASSISTDPGSAADCIRAVVLTTSPATIPWPSAPMVTAVSPVDTAARSCSVPLVSSPSWATADDQVKCGPHRPFGVVFERDRRAPDGDHGVADELLEGAAVASDDPAGGVEVAGQQLTHVLGVALLREGCEPHQVGKQNRCHPAFADRRRWARRDVSGALSAVPHSPQNRSPGSFAEPQAGQETTSATPHSAQKRRPSRLSVSQLEQRTRQA